MQVISSKSEIVKVSDKNIYPPEDIKIARFAKALGHPARISILRHLATLDTCRFTDISNELSLANSTVYQHLAELRRAGLIQGCIDPPRIQYCINYENWKLLRKYFKDFAEIEITKYEKSK
jgi:predicted transcriptional regulator